jgi:hypothetical protein
VLRRVFGLAEEASEDDPAADVRLNRLLGQVEEAVGHRPALTPARKGYALLSGTHEPIAFLRAQRGRLRVTASKQSAEAAGLSDWHRERSDTDFRGGSVSWYATDGDQVAYQEVASLLAKLLKLSGRAG